MRSECDYYYDYMKKDLNNMVHVYWINDDISKMNLNKGYIGVTSRPAHLRWSEHLEANSKVGTMIRTFGLKFKKNLVVIFSGTSQECYNLEYALRPTVNCGWNVAEGGETNSFSRARLQYQSYTNFIENYTKARPIYPK